jgi:hypothetical protein
MPTIPVYGDNVAPAALPGARLGVQATPSAFGAGVAQGASNLADVSFDIQQQERRKADQVRMLDLDRQLGEWENAKLYDPQTGAFQKRGKDAFDLPQTVMDDFDQFAGQLQGGLTSDQQRLAAQQLIDSRRTAVQRAVQGHVAGEIKGFEDTAFKGVMDTSRNAALANYQDSDRVAAEAERQRIAVAGYARRNGLPDTWVEDTAGKAQSATYAGAITRMLDTGDDLAAKAAYARWQGNLTGDDASRIDSALKESSTRGESRRQADSILVGATDLQGALAELEKRGLDTDVYDQTKRRLVDHFALAKAAEDQHQSDLFDQATLAIDQSATPGDPATVPASTWTTLNPKYKRELLAYQAARAKGVPIATNWDTYYQLRSVASAEATRDQFLQTDLRAFRSQLADGEFKQLTDLQAEMRTNRPKADQHLDEVASLDDVINRRLVDVGIDPSNNVKNASAPRANAFRFAVEKAVAAEQVRTGKKLSTDEMGKIADQLLIEQTVKTKRAWYSPVNPLGLNPFEDGYSESKVRTFEIPGVAATVADVPAADATAIRARFQQRHGRAPSDLEVLGVYNTTLAGTPNGQ